MRMIAPGLAAAVAAFAAVPCLAHDGGPNDAQIAAIVVVANQVDVDAGELAKSKAGAPEVRRFAERMVVDHTGVNQQAKALVAKLGVTPQPSDTSQALAKGGDENLASLRTRTGADFDRAYVAHEVAYHEQVLDALDRTLIPDAHDAQLKALLVKVRPAFVAHLEHAKHLQGSLSK